MKTKELEYGTKELDYEKLNKRLDYKNKINNIIKERENKRIRI